jgi:glutamate-1-semialdehyde aminotransferase
MTNDTELAALVERLIYWADRYQAVFGSLDSQNLLNNVADIRAGAATISALQTERDNYKHALTIGDEVRDQLRARVAALEATVKELSWDGALNDAEATIAQLQSANALLQKRVEAADDLADSVAMRVGEWYLSEALKKYRATAHADVAQEDGDAAD